MGKIEKFFEVINYFILTLLIVGQCVTGINFLLGQLVYLIANAISVSRCWVLHRPVADKVKDCACLGITIGLIGMKLLGGIV